MSTLYYLGLTVASLSVGIYNFSMFSSGSSLQCYNIDQMDVVTFEAFKASFIASNTTPPTGTLNKDDPTVYDVKVPGGNLLGLLAIVISFSYFLITAISLVLCLIIKSMSNQLPEDFLNISGCKRCLAAFCKILPPVLIIVHWIIGLVIVGIWAMLLMKSCIISTDSTPGAIVDEKQFYSNINTLNVVNSGIWVLIHYGGGIFREIVYQEPFMYSPDIGKTSAFKSLILRKLGP
jgi:hypothetical protein